MVASKSRIVWTAVAAVACLASPVARAEDAVRNATERAADRRELRDDRRELADDRGDRLHVEILRDDFAAAAGAGDAVGLAALDAQVEAYLAAELGEAVEETGDARRELRRDRREFRSDRREIRANRRSAVAPDERADDRRDLTRETVQAQSLAEIRTTWVALSDDASRAGAIATKRTLLEGLALKARAELGQGVRETREDRRELREDRRETREDRRDG